MNQPTKRRPIELIVDGQADPPYMDVVSTHGYRELLNYAKELQAEIGRLRHEGVTEEYLFEGGRMAGLAQALEQVREFHKVCPDITDVDRGARWAYEQIRMALEEIITEHSDRQAGDDDG